MPSGVKAAPPQQSKLEEMWGGKRKKAAAKESPTVPDISPLLNRCVSVGEDDVKSGACIRQHLQT